MGYSVWVAPAHFSYAPPSPHLYSPRLPHLLPPPPLSESSPVYPYLGVAGRGSIGVADDVSIPLAVEGAVGDGVGYHNIHRIPLRLPVGYAIRQHIHC